MKWKTKKTTWVFLYIKYSKFWSVSLEYFIKCKPLVSEECNIPNGKYLPNQNEICTHIIHILLLRLKNRIAANKTSKWSFSTSIILINLSFLKSKFWYMYFLKIHVRKIYLYYMKEPMTRATKEVPRMYYFYQHHSAQKIWKKVLYLSIWLVILTYVFAEKFFRFLKGPN